MPGSFDYHSAFARNIGWVTTEEQAILRSKRVAIAGMGGVGGSHLLTLTRLGIGAFNIADFDCFELANFNRQAGAALSTLNRPKVDVLADAALDINPTLDIRRFPTGVTEDNLPEFLAGVDIYVDALDFFAVQARRAVFEACAKLGIPAVTAAPLGMGAALLNFLPGGMSFEEYFRLDGQPEEEQLLRFLLGLSPAMLQRGYLVDPSAVDFARHRGPSTPMACELCAGVAATETLKILLNRGKIKAAPHGIHFDAYRAKLAHTWRPGGNRNPIQRLGLAIARRQLARTPPESPAEHIEVPAPRVVEQILDLARWAPSGDNTQPWRFEIIDDHHVVVHGHDTRDHCVYDLQGHASQISLGALLETIAIAATAHGLRATFRRHTDAPETRPTLDVDFVADPQVPADPLLPYIPVRTVQRRAMRLRRLADREKQALEEAVSPAYRVLWFETLRDRLRVTRLTFKNAGLRLTLPEAYPTHRDIIQWNARYSDDRIPDRAVGLDPLTTRLTRWALQRWERVAFLNRYLGGTLLPRIELELIPGIACAGHFVLLAQTRPQSADDFLAAGRAVQRFWLTATRLGLSIQPEVTPLVFHEYSSCDVAFSTTPGMAARAQHISRQFQEVVGRDAADLAVFMGRIGSAKTPKARSTRLDLKRLLHSPKST